MASVTDFLDSNGILRSLLTKTLNDKVYPLYPQTHSDVVYYNETTVKLTLDRMIEVLTNIQNIVNSTTKAMSELEASTFTRSYVIEAIDKINNSIADNTNAVITLRQDLDNLDYYTQPEVDQKIKTIVSDTRKSIELLNTTISELSVYVNSSFETSYNTETRISDIKKIIDENKQALYDYIKSWYSQTTVDLDEMVDNALSNYYNRESIDNKISNINTNIDNINTNFNILRGDNVAMNTKAESHISDQISVMKDNLMTHNDNKLFMATDDIKSIISESIDQSHQQYNNTLGTIGEVNSSINSKLDSIMSYLDGIGMHQTTITYDSADEKVY